MRRQLSILFCLAILAGTSAGTCRCRAQQGGVSLGFHNDTKAGVLVQGTSIVNNVPRRGQPFLVTPGKTGYDSNVPAGLRYISIYDAAQPSRVLLFNAPLPVQNRDMVFSVRPVPNGQGQVVLHHKK